MNVIRVAWVCECVCVRLLAGVAVGGWGRGQQGNQPNDTHKKKWNHHSRHSKKQTRTIHGYYLDNKVTFTHWVLLCSGFFCPLLKGFCCYCFKLQQGGEERGTKKVVKHLFCPFGTPIDMKWAETGSWWRAFPLPSLSTCLNTLPHWAVGRGRRRRRRCWATSSLDMYLI